MKPPAHFDAAVDAILRSGAPAADVAQALLEVRSEIAQLRAEHNQAAWAEGRKGEGAAKIDWLSDTLTNLLRRFAANTVVLHDDFAELSRYACQLRRALRVIAPDVRIETVQKLGYRLVAGFESVYRLLNGGRTSALGVAGFTPKEVMILGLLAEWGALHKDQVRCLVKHSSNIRAKLKPFGIVMKTEGDGLYSADKLARAAIKKLLSGELRAPPIAKGKPALQLVAA